MSIALSRIDPDQTFVWGKTPDMARRLLAAAELTGVPSEEVRAVDTGFIVPSAVWDAVVLPEPTEQF